MHALFLKKISRKNENICGFCFMQYYLKAKFHFNKDQFADLMIIVGAAGSISQVENNVT